MSRLRSMLKLQKILKFHWCLCNKRNITWRYEIFQHLEENFRIFAGPFNTMSIFERTVRQSQALK